MANVTLSTSWTQIDYWTAPYYDYITQTNYTAQLRLVAKVTSQSIPNNTSEVYFKWQKRLSSSASGRSVYNNNSYTYNITCNGAGGEGHSASITFTPGTVSSTTWTDVGGTNYWGDVTHNSDGTLTVSATATGTRFSGVAFETPETLTFPTIARASKPTVSTDTLVMGNSLTIYTHRASESFAHTITVTCGEHTETYTNVATNKAFTATASTWMPYMSSWEQTATVRCTTYNGSTQIGSVQTCTFKLRVDTSVYHPTIYSVTATDTNSTTTALETSGTFIKEYSVLSVAVSASMSSSDYNYALASGSVTYNGSTQGESLSGQSGSFTKSMGTVNGTPAVIKATDNRGYTVSQNQALTIIPYANISITSIALERVNAQGQASETGEYVKYDIKCKAFSGSFGQVTNEIEVYSISSAAGGSTYTTQLEQTYTTTGNGSVTDVTISGITLGTYSASSQFDISFRLEDKLSTATSTKHRVHEGVPVYAWGQDHFDVYGAFHIHDRSDVTKYMTFDMDNVEQTTVTFSGADGGSVTWTVFKFGSYRIATCGWRSTSNYAIDQSWGGTYYSNNIYTPNFPFTFSSVLYQSVRYVGADSALHAEAWDSGHQGATSTTNFGYVYLTRPNDGGAVTVGHPRFMELIIGTV